MIDLSQERKERLLKEADIQIVQFPDCCLNCKFINEDVDYCRKLEIFVVSIQICNFHANCE